MAGRASTSYGGVRGTRRCVLHPRFRRIHHGAPRLGAADATGYFGQYLEAKHGSPVVFCVDKGGRELWSRRFEAGRGTGGLLLSRNGVYFGMEGTGTIHALDPVTGALLWAKPVGTPTGGFSEGIILSLDGTLYAGVEGTPEHPDEACLVALR